MTASRGILAPRQYWRADQLALLASMYPDCHAADVAVWVERTMSAVYQAAKKLGVSKSPEYLASDTACRIRRGKQHPSMIASRFQPGQAAWNKGTKGLMGQHENCRRTQFRKGRKPEESRNYLPIGSHRFNKDGYWERKVSDDQSIVPARRWESVARIVWKAERGHIPANHIVRFKPGMSTDLLEQITIDRLECITRLENMRRNSLHTIYPPEVARVVQLRGALQRQINKRQREFA